jgi:ribosome-binding protein aMBF1 (putative translation factor)
MTRDGYSDLVATSANRAAFGASVRDKRAKLEMSQADLAEAAQCLTRQVQDAEVGRCYLPGVLRRIAGALGIEPGKVQG